MKNKTTKSNKKSKSVKPGDLYNKFRNKREPIREQLTAIFKLPGARRRAAMAKFDAKIVEDRKNQAELRRMWLSAKEKKVKKAKKSKKKGGKKKNAIC